MTRLTPYPASPILWGVVEEHFEEAVFLFDQWDRAFRLPAYTLAELAATLERRLEAHLDALVVGGKEVAARLLLPELANSEEPARATVAALALLANEDEAATKAVLSSVDDAVGPLRNALIRAIGLSSAARIEPLLLERFRALGSSRQRAGFLAILTARGIDPAQELAPCLESGDPELVNCALAAVRRFGRHELLALAENHLKSNDPEIRLHAIRACLAFGSWHAWQICLELGSTTPDMDILALIAMLGKPADHEILLKHLAHPTRAERVLWLLGFCGTAIAADVCVHHLDNGKDRLAKAAAESIAWISGLSLREARFCSTSAEPQGDETLPALEDDDLEANLELDGVDSVPPPNTEAIALWWRQNRARFESGQRWLLGKPFSPAAMIDGLTIAPLWRRAALAMELSIRTGGRHHLSTDASSSRQFRQIAGLSGMNFVAAG